LRVQGPFSLTACGFGALQAAAERERRRKNRSNQETELAHCVRRRTGGVRACVCGARPTLHLPPDSCLALEEFASIALVLGGKR
jgi:hypothetical protein